MLWETSKIGGATLAGLILATAAGMGESQGVLAIVAPGQGSQTPGLLAPWLEIPSAAAVIARACDSTGLDLVALDAAGDAALLRPTEVAQPFVVTASLAAAAAIASDGDGDGTAHDGLACDVVAGHSVGEWAAAVVGGYLDAGTALRLVAARGRAMATAAGLAPPSGMSAVLGGDEAAVLAALESLGLIPANVNGAGQIVAAGPLETLARLAEKAPPGSRVRALEVAAAFHTPTMAPALPLLTGACGSTAARAGHAAFIGNAAGAQVTPQELIPALIAQVARPVRFDRCLAAFSRLGVTAVLELPPAGVLTALVRRQLPGIAMLALKGPDDVPAARAFIARHARSSATAAVTVPA